MAQDSSLLLLAEFTKSARNRKKIQGKLLRYKRRPLGIPVCLRNYVAKRVNQSELLTCLSQEARDQPFFHHRFVVFIWIERNLHPLRIVSVKKKDHRVSWKNCEFTLFDLFFFIRQNVAWTGMRRDQIANNSLRLSSLPPSAGRRERVSNQEQALQKVPQRSCCSTGLERMIM